ncbi:ubiquitin carboxyl-terminal hydrolase [Paraburkholderia dioscoreae]|uniref:Uncharacterized protein n=1 Tax=Paraburkholderia dioscoreae TaxID=2604047 RepID=A0A5Q4YU60_9BURK|nr:hypothetical protein [Paraburkholderia dioscoreae]VVD29963.1 conserved protein of unknown function [Paraburkholderia dioscoreae]
MTALDSAARPEQSKQQPVNLASLPLDEALQRAYVAGEKILIDSDAIAAVSQDLWTNWMNANVPNACGQSEDEYGALLNLMMNHFFHGLTEGVKRFAEDARTMERVERDLCDHSRWAWKVYNVLAFMSEAISDDRAGELPVRCTVVDLRLDVEKLATDLMDLVRNARHG